MVIEYYKSGNDWYKKTTDESIVNVSNVDSDIAYCDILIENAWVSIDDSQMKKDSLIKLKAQMEEPVLVETPSVTQTDGVISETPLVQEEPQTTEEMPIE